MWVSAGVDTVTASAPAGKEPGESSTTAASGCSRDTNARRSADRVATATRLHWTAEAINGAWKYPAPKP